MSKRLSFLLVLLLLSSFFILFSAPTSQSIQEAETITTSRSLAPPSSRSDNGRLMNLTESVNAFKLHDLNTTNIFPDPSFNVTKLEDSFDIQVPTNYTTAWQDITFSNIVAGPEYIAVQDGIGTGSWFDSSYLMCGRQLSPNVQYSVLAINFTVPVRVNLTSVWLRYGAVQVTYDPPRIPLNIETDSPGAYLSDHVPSGTVLGNGTLDNSTGAAWKEVQIQTSGGAPVTLEPRTTYWLVMNGSSIPPDNTGYYEWYYLPDSGGRYDDKCVAVMLMPETEWSNESEVSPYFGINLLSVLFVKAVDSSLKTMVYSSPAQVQMAINGTPVSGNTVSVNASKTFFQFTTNCSVTFTANWTARFEYPQPSAVSTRYLANNGFTIWNASFLIGTKPPNPYTWYDLTFKITSVPTYWSVPNPPTNITNTPQNYPFSFTLGSGYYLITQTNDINKTPWNNNWFIMSRSSYKVSATIPRKVVAGVEFSYKVWTDPYLPCVCNSAFYNSAGYLDPADNFSTSIGTSPSLISHVLSKSGNYTLFIFNGWGGGNEVSLNETLTVTALEPKAMLTVNATRYAATYGENVSVGFTLLNATGGTTYPFTSAPTLYRNGTPVSFAYIGSGSYVHVLNTRSIHRTGTCHLNFTAQSGVFAATNITILDVSKLQMNLTLVLDRRSVPANSSLSASATLRYPNGTAVEDHTKVTFNFNVTYNDNTFKVFNDNETTQNGVARSLFLATANMSKISVGAVYAGDDFRLAATAVKQDVTVTLPAGGFSFIMVVGTGVVGALMVVAVFLVIARRRKGEEKRVKKELRLAESGSLAQLVVVDKASGRNLWNRKLGTVKGVNPHLISGFLSANESILGVIFKSKEAKARLKFADYNYYKVIGEAGRYIMAALFCTERPGAEMRNALAEFTKRFEAKYKDAIRSWKGDMDVFKSADQIFNEVFPLTTTSAYAINAEKLGEVKLSRTAEEVLHRAEQLSATRGFFFMPRIIEFLLTEKKKKRSAVMDILDELSRAGIFKQLTIEEAMAIPKRREKNAAKTH